tara:strand:+ start:303 stop:770 length:468 start_codon:yes stop_codon:yes gene_type:complete
VHEKQIIRKATLEDLDCIFSIEKKAFGNDHWSFDMIKNELINEPNSITWIVQKNRIVVAYCMIRIIDKEIHMMNIAVKPELQDLGIGRLLIEHFLNSIPYKSSVFLEVKKGNFPAINLYSSFGFEKISIRKKYYRDGSDAFVMYLRKLTNNYGMV